MLHPTAKQPLHILDRHGELLYEARKADFGSQKILTYEELPPQIIKALISIEDRNFWSHPGLSLRGILRAASDNYRAGHIVSGGSTITQQLIRIRLQPKNRNYWYKFLEAYYATRIELRESKEAILTDYLNSAYFGHQAYGLAAAAKTYFGKNVSELSLAESALLVGIIQSPVNLDPFISLPKAKLRQNQVLSALLATGAIDTATYASADAEPLRLTTDRTMLHAPHFVMWLLNKKLKDSSQEPAEQKNPNTIQTTLDLNLQEETERIVARELEKLKDKNVTSAAVVVLDAKTGELLTMVGSSNYFDTTYAGQVNVTTAPRQPGSALKPFTYALALAKGLTSATTIPDIETQFFTAEGNPYIPRNYDFGYHGLVRLREALANSYNIAAVRTLEKVGVDNLLSLLNRAGITTLTETPTHYGLALTLGAGEVKLLELTQAYGIFARSGKTLPIKFLLEKNTDSQEEAGYQIIDPSVAWLIADILSDNTARIPEFGTESALAFDFPVGAKTGTTRNSRDNWTIGFTGDRLVGVWVGNADNTPMQGTSGVSGAGPIFHAVMLAATNDRPHTWIAKPANIVERDVCKLSGKLPTALCPEIVHEYFIQGTEPREQDDIYQLKNIDTRNGLLAGRGCAKNFVLQQKFTIFPTEVRRWARENGYLEPPARYSPLCPDDSVDTTSQADLLITKPHPRDEILLDPLIPAEHQKIILEAEAPISTKTVTWFVDGTQIGIGLPPNYHLEWQPKVGLHQIEARSDKMQSKITITIKKTKESQVPNL